MFRRGMVSRKFIIVGLVIIAAILAGYLIYSQIQFSNQAYKIENFIAFYPYWFTRFSGKD